MRRAVPEWLAVISCALLLAACGHSVVTDDASDQSAIPQDDPLSVVGDGDGLQSADGSMTPPVDLPGANPLAIDNLGPEQDSQLLVNDRQYPLNSALGDIWGVSDDHYNINFTLSNGKFLVRPEEIDGVTYTMLVPIDTTAIFHAEMFSPGTQFSFVTYSYSPFGAGGGVLAGNAFFEKSYVGFDVNHSGDVEDNEKLQVVGGTVEFRGTLPDISLHFSVKLEDGQSADGHYTGLFDFTRRQ